MIRPASALLLLLSLPAAAVEPDSEEGIVQEAWALERDPVLRPTHVDPALPGTFEDGLAPWADALNASAERFQGKDAPRPLAEYLDKGGPVPANWRAELEHSTAMLNGALAATYRAGARLPPGGRLEGLFSDQRPGSAELWHLWRLALLDAVLASGRGAHELALQRCADVLALSRDLSRGYLVMAMVGGSMVSRSVNVCYRLARQAPPAQRRRFLNSVERIRSGWGPSSGVFRQERLFGQLCCASRFDEKQRAALPTSMNAVVNGCPDQLRSGGIRGWLFGGLVRQALWEQMTALIGLADRSPEEADPAVSAIDATTPTSVRLAGFGTEASTSSWLQFLRRMRTFSARMTLLQAALAADLFHSERGSLPKTWSDVFPAGAPIDPRTGRAFALDLRPDAAAVQAEADASRDAEELSLPLR